MLAEVFENHVVCILLHTLLTLHYCFVWYDDLQNLKWYKRQFRYEHNRALRPEHNKKKYTIAEKAAGNCGRHCWCLIDLANCLSFHSYERNSNFGKISRYRPIQPVSLRSAVSSLNDFHRLLPYSSDIKTPGLIPFLESWGVLMRGVLSEEGGLNVRRQETSCRNKKYLFATNVYRNTCLPQNIYVLLNHMLRRIFMC